MADLPRCESILSPLMTLMRIAGLGLSRPLKLSQKVGPGQTEDKQPFPPEETVSSRSTSQTLLLSQTTFLDKTSSSKEFLPIRVLSTAEKVGKQTRSQKNSRQPTLDHTMYNLDTARAEINRNVADETVTILIPENTICSEQSVGIKARIFPIYSIIILFLQWSIASLVAAVFWTDSVGTFKFLSMRITMLLYLSHVALLASYFGTARSARWLSEVLSLLHMYHCFATVEGIPQNHILARMKKMCWCAVFVIVFIMALMISAFCYLVFFNFEDSFELLRTMIPEIVRRFQAASCLFLLGHAYSFVSWSSLLALQIVLIGWLSGQFKLLADVISSQCVRNEDLIWGKLKTYRLLYMDLCNITKTVNSYVSFLMAITILMNTLNIVVCASSFVMSSLSSYFIVTYVTWLLMNALGFLIMSNGCGSLHEQAKAPLMTLLGLRSVTSCPQQLGELNLWLTSIIHGETGITALGFFTITKESVLTILGLAISYFVVIIQFRLQ